MIVGLIGWFNDDSNGIGEKMTKNALNKVGNHINTQFQIMRALENELNIMKQKAQDEDKKKIEQMELLLKILAREAREIGEEVLENVA